VYRPSQLRGESLVTCCFRISTERRCKTENSFRLSLFIAVFICVLAGPKAPAQKLLTGPEIDQVRNLFERALHVKKISDPFGRPILGLGFRLTFEFEARQCGREALFPPSEKKK
jgi:hypothetical protein